MSLLRWAGGPTVAGGGAGRPAQGTLAGASAEAARALSARGPGEVQAPPVEASRPLAPLAREALPGREHPVASPGDGQVLAGSR